jgi:hypothetical protein
MMLFNSSWLAHKVRRSGIAIAKLAHLFTRKNEEEEFVRAFFRMADWGSKLDGLSDRQLGRVGSRIFGFEMGTKEDALISEILDRLARSTAGPNRFEDQQRPYRGAALFVKLVRGVCDKCHRVGYVDTKVFLCPWDLAAKIITEERVQKLRTTVGPSATRPANESKKVR